MDLCPSDHSIRYRSALTLGTLSRARSRQAGRQFRIVRNEGIRRGPTRRQEENAVNWKELTVVLGCIEAEFRDQIRIEMTTTRWDVLDEIYQISDSLHISDPHNSANIRHEV